jgi:hypothetical protein
VKHVNLLPQAIFMCYFQDPSIHLFQATPMCYNSRIKASTQSKCYMFPGSLHPPSHVLQFQDHSIHSFQAVPSANFQELCILPFLVLHSTGAVSTHFSLANVFRVNVPINYKCSELTSSVVYVTGPSTLMLYITDATT